MSAFTFTILVRHFYTIELISVFYVVFIQKIIFSDSYPVKLISVILLLFKGGVEIPVHF